jgi:hypothetical protein
MKNEKWRMLQKATETLSVANRFAACTVDSDVV